MRALVRLGTVLALVGSVLLLPTAGTSPTGTAQAADLSYFDPGNIIADAVFFDSLAVDTPTVQAFLAAKGASCVAGEQPCLKDYRQTTATQQGDAYCSTYTGAANETAAAIIVKVGQACGINPRVLIVLLQKEQGLVTGTRPATIRYTKATGFACPDTAACNPQFSGFASQVYFAARQFQRYAANAAGSYRAGRNNTVLFHPNSACGSSQVFIQNKATAGLYSYTPYQPNGAALAAGYGTGDSCSSYGNRNFWNYFTDWFGSTQSVGGSAIYQAWNDRGGASGPLGAASSPFLCGLASGGCYQQFAQGRIYWTPSTGARSVLDPALTAYTRTGSENGPLGYPTTDSSCTLRDGTCYQLFTGGGVYSSATIGTSVVRGAIRAEWQQGGSEWGPLGFPTGDEVCGLASGGCRQEFEGGRVYWAPATGAQAVLDAQLTAYAAAGTEGGPLGYPRGDVDCSLRDGTCYQLFTGGAVYSSPTIGSHSIRGGIRDAWVQSRSEWGPLGFPTTSELCGLVGGGCYQQFERGRIYWSPATGAKPVLDAQLSAYTAVGSEHGPLGYPRGAVDCSLRDSACYQLFTGGSVYSSPTIGSNSIRGGIRDAWQQSGSEWGPLGFPTTSELCGLVGGGCYQQFERGRIYWSPTTGAQAVPSGPILDYWTAQGGQDSLGYPVAAQSALDANRVAQRFERATLVLDRTTGQVTRR